MPPVTIVGVAANTGVTVCRRGLSRARLVPSWVRLLVAVAAVAVAAVGNADVPLPAQPAFALVVLAVVGCFDVLTVVLLVGHFRDTGGGRFALGEQRAPASTRPGPGSRPATSTWPGWPSCPPACTTAGSMCPTSRIACRSWPGRTMPWAV